MKKVFGAVMLVLVMLCVFASAAEEPVTTTVMVYMCGSNLESRYSLATKDIFEMIESEYDGDYTDVVLMIGGSEKWELPSFDPEKSGIYQIRGSSFKRIWQGEAMNMGKSDTLGFFLNTVYEKYASDRYALIFWNHGGGPMNGVCWDENFDKDSLSMSELIAGIKNSPFSERKLDLIGFDACLMGSVETAWMLSEYVHYMVASEETEPGSGWNYGFLSGIEKDASVEETGKRIVNMYIDSFPADHPTGITLSLIDLSKIHEVTDKMNDFFSELSGKMNMDMFRHMSTIRHYAQAYGRDQRVEESSDYDMVDMGNLVDTCIEYAPETGGALKQALEKAIVLSRSNLENSTGLSVYFPYFNETAYAKKGEDFRRSVFLCPGYTEYIGVFQDYLIGKITADWKGLTPEVSKRLTENGGGFDISLVLTEEQRKNLVSAKLVVLEANINPETIGCSYYRKFGSSDVTIDSQKGLIAQYHDESIVAYGYNEDGVGITIKSVPFTVLESGEYVVEAKAANIIDFYDVITTDWGTQGVLEKIQLVLNAPDEEGNMPLKAIYVYDEMTNSYSQRADFSMDEYEFLHLMDYQYYMERQNELIKPFELWSRGYSDAQMYRTTYLFNTLLANEPWTFKMIKGPSSTCYAAFEITDVHNNKFLTELTPIRTMEKDALLTYESFRTEDSSLEFLYMCFARRPDDIGFSVFVQNGDQNVYSFDIDEITIDGKACDVYSYVVSSPALAQGDIGGMWYSISSYDLADAIRASDDGSVTVTCDLWLYDVQTEEYLARYTIWIDVDEEQMAYAMEYWDT